VKIEPEDGESHHDGNAQQSRLVEQEDVAIHIGVAIGSGGIAAEKESDLDEEQSQDTGRHPHSEDTDHACTAPRRALGRWFASRR
jgi:hypothetical protein